MQQPFPTFFQELQQFAGLESAATTTARRRRGSLHDPVVAGYFQPHHNHRGLL